MYPCFKEYDHRQITFKEVKTRDTFCTPCINLFVKYDVLEYICDYFNYTLKLKIYNFFAYQWVVECKR